VSWQKGELMTRFRCFRARDAWKMLRSPRDLWMLLKALLGCLAFVIGLFVVDDLFGREVAVVIYPIVWIVGALLIWSMRESRKMDGRE
jgi:hypothetical protein